MNNRSSYYLLTVYDLDIIYMLNQPFNHTVKGKKEQKFELRYYVLTGSIFELVTCSSY